MNSQKILESVKLPTLSKTLYEIIELEKRNPITFLKDIKTIIEKDPLLSAHILKVANSPLYGFSQKVRTISHAIGLLGARKIRSIAFTFSIFDFFKKVKFQPQFGRTFNLILKKSLIFSAISTILANKTEQINADELYVTGLLADIGQIILFLHAPDKYQEIYSSTDNELLPKEESLFGINHVQLGVTFCDQWNFPSFIRSGIENHAHLGADDGHSKICYISNQLVELLLTEKEEDKKRIFKELENHTKKLLHISLPEVEETIKSLPLTMEDHINDFPELQKDLNRIVETGSALIISLMKNEMDMVLKTQELTHSQRKLAREKIFLSHMLNLSYFLSSLVPPKKVIRSLFEYFHNFITDLSIEFIYKVPENGKYLLMKGKKDEDGVPICVDAYSSLIKAKISNEVTRLDPDEMKKMDKNPGLYCIVFPISYHHNFFGYLLLMVEKNHYFSFDLEMSYVQILANIIANSFQNYHSFRKLKQETNKKEMVTKELFKFDKELDHSKKMALQLQKSEIVAEMLPVIFHKLKNKLTPILGYSQILLAKVQDEGFINRIRKIEKNANELAEQLNMLRDYFKSDVQLKERDNLNSIINNMKPYFNRIEAEEDIKINLALDNGIPMDVLIPGQMEVLISHLVDNAAQSIKRKGARDGLITIRTEVEEDGYSLSVRDNGIGLDENELALIWTPFHSGFEKQTGLGLSVCEKIIANHKATRDVESVKGQYTEFKVSFETAPQEQEIPEDLLAPAKESVGKILIVDDEAYLADLMKEVLLTEGNFEITTTTRGEEALELIDTDFDVIITDIRMPGVNGMDLYNSLKLKRPEAKVMMVTADPYSDDVAEFLEVNRIDYLKKPFELMEFRKKVLEKLS